MGISYQKKLKSLEEKKAVHASCKHGVRRICQLYTKGGPAGKLTSCEPPRDHLDYRRRDNIQRSRLSKVLRRISYVAGRGTSRDFVARGRPLRGQKRLTPLAKRSTYSKSRLHVKHE